ncbi:hypothetical protein F6455_05240 [Proteobacteria bacterium 005FR1]|nr:hypothetical protein [Proteobacteria bacterium 005FR1]
MRSEVFEIPLSISDIEKVADISLEIRTGDDDLIRRLSVPINDDEAVVQWDGRDEENRIVPDEAYHPVLVVEDKSGKTQRIDARDYSGGEEVYHFEKNVRQGEISYTLPVPARVLVRAGIKNGPMLATVVDWEPRTRGFHAERWSGRDKDGLIAVAENPQVGYLIIGYQLPEHTIITYGNKQQSYRLYRQERQWPLRQADYANAVLERSGKLVRPEFNTPVTQQKSPRIAVTLTDPESREPTKEVTGFEEMITRVELHPEDEAYLDQERYEVTFFVDNVFIAEEEQGFVPFNWRWSPAQYGLEPGSHVLTVNVSGYRGQVGVRNIEFTLKNQ